LQREGLRAQLVFAVCAPLLSLLYSSASSTRHRLSAGAMPLHTIGLSQPRSFYGLTFADLMSCVIAFLFYAQPGVDHKAVFQWIVDNAFGGSVALVAVAGTFISHKILEWCGLLWFEAMYQLDKRKHLPGSKAIASMKIDTDTPWAWDSPDAKVGTKYADLKSRSLKYIVTFHAIVSVVQFGLIYFATQWKRVDGQWTWSWLPDHPDYVRADANLIPSKATVAYQCLVSLFISESGFYFAHRLMHETRLYYWHKRHHEFKVRGTMRLPSDRGRAAMGPERASSCSPLVALLLFMPSLLLSVCLSSIPSGIDRLCRVLCRFLRCAHHGSDPGGWMHHLLRNGT
jgi:sterol desaturase/sphingolipid hydroxylase (fatty acid hydroxylase superfamily)